MGSSTGFHADQGWGQLRNERHHLRAIQPFAQLNRAVGIHPDEVQDYFFQKGRGCRACHGRGYRGRMAIYEVMALDDDLRRLILRAAPEDELQACAERQGMRPLQESAKVAVREGVTTPEEMGRVVLTKEAG
jgi:general secretion pathway protein E